MVVSLNTGISYRPQNKIVLTIGTPKKVLLIVGNPHIGVIWALGLDSKVV